MSNAPKAELRIDFDAIEWLAGKGIDVLGGGLDEATMKKPATYRLLVWAGLLHANPETTEADAKAWTKGMKLNEVIAAVTASIQEATGKADGEAEASPASS